MKGLNVRILGLNLTDTKSQCHLLGLSSLSGPANNLMSPDLLRAPTVFSRAVFKLSDTHNLNKACVIGNDPCLLIKCLYLPAPTTRTSS